MLRESIAIGCAVLTLGGTCQKDVSVNRTNVHVTQHSMTKKHTGTALGTTIAHLVHAVPTALYTAWARVNRCEEGGNWNSYGSAYPDALGIRATVWAFFGGRISKTYRPSIRAQILIGNKVIHYYHIPIPDQHGCQRRGW
jgi:hypothetical protein